MKIIIPMTGKSSRFKKAGIKTPKQFLKIENNYILKHIIDMFPGEKDINLIVNSLDLQNNDFKKYMMDFTKYNIHEIDFQESGPGGALLESEILNTKSEVLINYCDFANIWDWNKFKEFINKNQPDGVVPAYFGIHPHNIYDNDYAFIKNDDDKILNIREKESFTNKKINEYASTGSYYFKSGLLADKYIKRIFEKEKFVNDEVYISTPYEEMLNDSLDVRVFHIDYFFQWGTPEDYLEFEYNLNEVKNITDEKKIDLSNINLLIPAAGKGERFKKEGYKDSKINLKINDKKIIEQILSSCENQTETKILYHKNDVVIGSEFINKKNIITISERTGGQAESSLKLLDHVENDNPILFHSADCILDKNLIIDIGEFDVVVYTKSNYRRAFSQDLNYGWVNTEKGFLDSFSIKKPPKGKTSSVILGVFLFKNKATYIDLYNETVENSETNKEIHIDHLIETAKSKNMKIKIESTDISSMLGTPLEYELVKYMNKALSYLIDQ